jgi:hypothetical protein
MLVGPEPSIFSGLALSEPAMEDALYEIASLRTFGCLNLSDAICAREQPSKGQVPMLRALALLVRCSAAKSRLDQTFPDGL